MPKQPRLPESRCCVFEVTNPFWFAKDSASDKFAKFARCIVFRFRPGVCW